MKENGTGEIPVCPRSGEAVGRLIEESRKEGYINGLDQGYYKGRMTEIDMQEKLRLADFVEKDTSPA